MAQPKKIDVINPLEGGEPVFIDGYGVLQPSADAQSVTDGDDVRFLLEHGPLKLAPKTPTEEK